MSGWRGDPEEQPDRDVFAARLTPLPGPTGINPLAELLAAEVQATLRSLDEKRGDAGKQPLPQAVTKGLPHLTATALGAVEGTLTSKSLDGELKKAQILAAYAEARERNANADKAEAEAEQARIAAARDRLALVLETLRAVGVDPAVALSKNDVFAVLLGDGLSAPLAAAAMELSGDVDAHKVQTDTASGAGED
jgi:hypothetical protein